MGHRRLKLTKSQERLMELFSEIEDEGIRDIMASVVLIEEKHRSAGAKNFPRNKVRDVVDTMAQMEEMGTNAQGVDNDAA